VAAEAIFVGLADRARVRQGRLGMRAMLGTEGDRRSRTDRLGRL